MGCPPPMSFAWLVGFPGSGTRDLLWFSFFVTSYLCTWSIEGLSKAAIVDLCALNFTNSLNLIYSTLSVA